MRIPFANINELVRSSAFIPLTNKEYAMGRTGLSRRSYLAGVVGTAVALTGCQGLTDRFPSDSTPTENQTPDSGGGSSVYKRVYDQTIDSIVMLSVTARGGQQGQGSGFLIDGNTIVTNAHVVSRAESIEMQFARGEWRSATVLGSDPYSDLAAIEPAAVPDYVTPLPIDDREPAIGTTVVAIGTPFGLDGTMTTGIVSGLNRSMPAPNNYTIPDAVQTSAPVNPGNSGGPLLTVDGSVVGVISAGGGENLAFAISAPLLERVVPSLVDSGSYHHPKLGINAATVTPSVAEDLGMGRPRGVVVTEVSDPARGTIEVDDVIVRANDTEIDSQQQLSSFIALHTSPGAAVSGTLLRDGSEQTVEVTLGRREPASSPQQ
ncbi:S1C family serine protease [Halocatena halophila]|uniref:S1C family serine protease n=1 Tax=Halocatena halophila TaxID=2814576 RepID=UPI002ED2203E